jgi:hypothetical protein
MAQNILDKKLPPLANQVATSADKRLRPAMFPRLRERGSIEAFFAGRRF